MAPEYGDREHRVRITWSDAHVRRGLVGRTAWVAPAWFAADVPGAEGWSLALRFDEPPSVQGSPSTGHVRLCVPHAPHERLRPGTVLGLFEDVTSGRAHVEVLD